MKRTLLFFTLIVSVLTISGTTPKTSVCFTENKGQVGDQDQNPRPDILFGGTDGQLSFHLKNNGISYQLTRVNKWIDDELFDHIKSGFPKDFPKKRASDITIYRLDINWVNANINSVIKKGKTLEGYNNYYSPVCPNGALEVYSYEDITYQNIYSGIDLKWYQKGGHLKYDYIVAPGADPRNIQLEINGAQKLSLNADGDLVIKTPLGDIIEEAPYVTQNGKVIPAQWTIKKNKVGFRISNYNRSLPLLIDPGVRIWGTYYGGNDNDLVWSSVMEPLANNMFTGGYTSSVGGTIIATVGSHQSAHSGNGLENAFVVKWTQAGTRIWGTYYGGNVRDVGFAVSVDPAGNVFLCGNTLSNNAGAIATPGSHQPASGGDWDAYIVKFNSAGVRQWGTYYGSTGMDFGISCAADAFGNSFLCGKVNAAPGNVIATPGAHKTTYGGFEDAFLVKFDPNGVRLWGTYYGDDAPEVANGCITDASGNLYMVGQTSSTLNIATPGCHQAFNSGGNYDAFIVKFNGSGIRQWGTYYGGSGDDRGMAICRNIATGDIYISGNTDSGNGANKIATDGSHQVNNGGGIFDGFLAKFNSFGQRQWGTFYGGTGDDRVNGMAISQYGYIYIAGYTGSLSGTVIATPGSIQTTHGGGTFDSYLAQFDNSGSRLWSTYYGGNNFDLGEGCAVDNNNHVYLVGLTDCATGTTIATPGSHQSVYGTGASDGYFVQFYDCVTPNTPANVTSPANQNICAGNSTSLTATGSGTLMWYNAPVGGSSIGTGTTLITSTLSPGTYSYYASANTCTNSASRAQVIINVNSLPNLSVTASHSVLCAGYSATLFASGANNYTWNPGFTNNVQVISPTVTTTYTLTGKDFNGCSNTFTITQIVSPCATGILQNGTNSSQITIHPNPTSDAVIVDGIEMNSTITVYNAIGEIIISSVVNSNSFKTDLSERSPGIYFVKVTYGSSSKTFKVVKK